MAWTMSLAVPTPASTITGYSGLPPCSASLSRSITMRMAAGFATPRPLPMGLPAGMTLAAPASRRRAAMIGSSLE